MEDQERFDCPHCYEPFGNCACRTLADCEQDEADSADERRRQALRRDLMRIGSALREDGER